MLNEWVKEDVYRHGLNGQEERCSAICTVYFSPSSSEGDLAF